MFEKGIEWFLLKKKHSILIFSEVQLNEIIACEAFKTDITDWHILIVNDFYLFYSISFSYAAKGIYFKRQCIIILTLRCYITILYSSVSFYLKFGTDEEQSQDILNATVKHEIIDFNLFSNILDAN